MATKTEMTDQEKRDLRIKCAWFHKGIKYIYNAPARYNNGERCDIRIGPCACGAWHTAEELKVMEGKA